MLSEKLDLPYTFPVRDSIRVVRGGHNVEGRLFGGHIAMVQLLIGAPWAPNWEDVILFIEEADMKFYRTDRWLTHFKLAGLFESIRGLIVGQPLECEEPQMEALDDILLRVCAGDDFPIITNIPIGHTDDKITVPIGCRVRLNSLEPSFELLESPTR
jgi:muramoyltetrapeptide carboxypeptidase